MTTTGKILLGVGITAVILTATVLIMKKELKGAGEVSADTKKDRSITFTKA